MDRYHPARLAQNTAKDFVENYVKHLPNSTVQSTRSKQLVSIPGLGNHSHAPIRSDNKHRILGFSVHNKLVKSFKYHVKCMTTGYTHPSHKCAASTYLLKGQSKTLRHLYPSTSPAHKVATTSRQSAGTTATALFSGSGAPVQDMLEGQPAHWSESLLGGFGALC